MSIFDGLSDARVYTACAIVFLYLATSAYFLWPRTRRQPASAAANEGSAAPTLVAFASQTGFAEEIATRTAQSLESAGVPVRVANLRDLRESTLRESQQALFILSTTGEGDAPDPAASFVRNTLTAATSLSDLRYAVLALGDREYDNFCAFGHRVDLWLRHQNATAMFDVVEVDNGDEGALRHWPEGGVGLGSGWLTEQAKVGDEIAVRIRTNSNFHLPEEDRPLILIGNGTGIAGLRALLKARVAAARHRNWLIFGERNSAHDRYYQDDLDRWRAGDAIERIDLIFSRDASPRRYVQDRIVECADDMRRWVADGAAIYVCGSLQGMAPGVDAALTHVLGASTVEELAAASRYRRDVY